MEVNELQKQIRIGNHLLGKCIDDLDDRKEWWEIYKIQDADHLMGIKDSWDKPIELTEEILLKCGFVKLGNKFIITQKDEWNSQLIMVFEEGVFKIPVTGYWYGLYTLHQLQNLYFALTGEELEINL